MSHIMHASATQQLLVIVRTTTFTAIKKSDLFLTPLEKPYFLSIICSFLVNKKFMVHPVYQLKYQNYSQTYQYSSYNILLLKKYILYVYENGIIIYTVHKSEYRV